MTKIFIGIPTIRNYEPFWSSLENFLGKISDKYTYELLKVSNKSLSEARNEIVSRFLNSDKDYLLFLDDDHSGHTVEMLDSLMDPLINNGRMVCAIKCYTKFFPFFSNLLQQSGVDLGDGSGKYRPIEEDKGYYECDVVGFGMTLVSRETFKRIKEPYFISKNNYKEDVYFCDKLNLSGMRAIGCFDYVLDHQGIGNNNALQLRDNGMKELRKKFPDMEVLVS